MKTVICGSPGIVPRELSKWNPSIQYVRIALMDLQQSIGSSWKFSCLVSINLRKRHHLSQRTMGRDRWNKFEKHIRTTNFRTFSIGIHTEIENRYVF